MLAQAVDERFPEQSQQATLRSLGDEQVREIVERYVDAWEKGDVEAVRTLLAEDATFSMPPWPGWWRGRETIADFAKAAHEFCAQSTTLPTRANGQIAIAYYHKDGDTGRYKPAAIDVITLEGALIKDITGFVTPQLFPRFGLPPEVAP